MAADYAEAIDALGFDSVACLGISMGGLIAQHLVAEFDCTDWLVLSAAGCRLGERGKRTIRRWRDWAARGEWFRAVLDGFPRAIPGLDGGSTPFSRARFARSFPTRRRKPTS